MSKFNSVQATSVKNRSDATINFEGGLAFELDTKTRLYTKICTSLLDDKYYQKAGEHTKEIYKDIQEVAKIDPEFILKLAGYARNKMHLRSTPILLLGEAASINQCKPFVRKWVPKIIRRADELTEIVAYWIMRHGDIGDRGAPGGKNAFPNCLKKGIADVFNNFDEYAIQKYNRNNSVKLKDVLRIAHPKPHNKAQEALYKWLIDGTINRALLPKIAASYDFARLDKFDSRAKKLIEEGSITWEVAISKFGNKKEIWNSLDLPIMASIRNLRNLLQSGADISKTIDKLQNEEIIKKSKQLPFRYFSAYREIESISSVDTGCVLDALCDAVDISINNIPTFEGSTLIACDNSASMTVPLSTRGKVTYKDIANLLGAMANTFCEKSIVGVFATKWQPVSLSKRSSVLDNMNKLASIMVGGGTEAWKVLDWAIKNNKEFDRFILLSDMQCYGRTDFWNTGNLADQVKEYHRKINPSLKVYSIDLSGYGTTQFPDDGNVVTISGWSEKIFDFINLWESDKFTAINTIEQYI